MCDGRDVILVDADRQGSASLWVDSRLERNLPAPSTVRQFDTGLRRAVRDLARRYEDVIVDIGSGDGVAQQELRRFKDIKHSELVIRERTSIRRAVPFGLLIDEYRPLDPKGVGEIRAVFKYVFQSA